VALQKALGESFARLEHGGCFGGTEDAQAVFLESVDNAEGEWELGADDGEVRFLSESELDHGIEVVEVDGNAASELGDAAVAGRADDLSGFAGALNSPGERVFAAARSKD
jgi:hypothetical protein